VAVPFALTEPGEGVWPLDGEGHETGEDGQEDEKVGPAVGVVAVLVTHRWCSVRGRNGITVPQGQYER
jgi:hypothetical protein